MQPYDKSINFNAIAFITLSLLTTIFATQRIISSQAINTSTDKIKFKGKIVASKDISAIGLVGKYILIGGDEGNIVQVLEPNKKGTKYKVSRNIELPILKSSKAEVDIEGIAVESNTVYVTGSHSLSKKAKDLNNRRSVFRFQLNSNTGKLESTIERASLQKILEQDEVLSQFANIEYDRNGVDIEGIAVKGDRLYFGFRTPVLQDDYVPVIAVEFDRIDRIDKYQLYHVNLGGNGIRDLVSVDRGFLILADTTAENDSRYQVYFWDGNDDLSRSKAASGIKLLSEIPTDKNTKAEGLTLLSETASSYQILVVYDGVAKGNPTIFEIKK